MILAVSSDGTIIPIAFKTNANAKTWLKSKDYDVDDYSFSQLKVDPVDSAKAKAKKKSAAAAKIKAKQKSIEAARVKHEARIKAGLPISKSMGKAKAKSKAKVKAKSKK